MTDAAVKLAAECGGLWSVHPDYPVADWQYAVANGDTRQSYWDWVLHQLAIAQEG